MVGDGHRDCEPAVHQSYEHDPAVTTAASFERCPDCPRLPDMRNTFLPTEHGVLTIASVGPRSFPKCQLCG
jgi:hypothetical protein